MMALSGGFFQLGYVANNLDLAIDAIARMHGVQAFRPKQSSPTMLSAHAGRAM